MGFLQYFCACLSTSGGSAALSVVLWSRQGYGWSCLAFVQNHWELAIVSVGFIGLAFLALYLLDFFIPPHLPGQYLHFGEGREAAGRSLLTAIGVACFTACIFSAQLIPSLPLLATTFLSPVGVIVVHHVLISEETVENMSLEELARMEFEERIALLQDVTSREQEQKDFCAAAMIALTLVGLGCTVIWVPWGVRNEPEHSSSRSESEILFVLWVAPLVVGISNLIFGVFVSLRVMLNSRYKMTHSFKNRLLVANVLHSTREEVHRYRDVILQARNSFQKGMTVTMSPAQVDKYLTQHVSCTWLLSTIMKAIGCAFIVMICAIFVTFQLVTAVGRTTSLMVQSFTSAFFLTFVSFVAVCFGRLWQAMSHWLAEFPLWQSMLGVTKTAWARAAFALIVLPMVPAFLALSALNQFVRQQRGLTGSAKAKPRQSPAHIIMPSNYLPPFPSTGPCPGSNVSKDEIVMQSDPEEEERQILTRKVMKFLKDCYDWDWVPIVWWWYVLAWVLIVLKLTPLLLNVLLAEMNTVLGDLPFAVILVATFALGMVLFMLPPVPGPPIYLFGGVVISDACPLGFWWGSVICVALSFTLKLTACAVQQKLIGEKLGNSLTVRRTAGVHKPLVRAIELVLRKPGLSFDKCMILCGGPDWPTSVLAGILRLPLAQCLLGTTPIIASVFPLCLTGSFYLKRDFSPIWIRAGNLMFTLTAIVSVGFWAGMGWAIQDVYEKFQDELTEPREEYLELEWLDYREDFISQKLRLHWDDMPAWVRRPFLLGALSVTAVCHAVLWRSSYCFGSFSVTGDTRNLKWLGNEGLVRLPGAVALLVLITSSGGLLLFTLWDRQRRMPLITGAAQEVDVLEELWKEQKLQQARDNANARAWERACADEVIKRVSTATQLRVSNNSGASEAWSANGGGSSGGLQQAQNLSASTSSADSADWDVPRALRPVRQPSTPRSLDTG